MGRKRRDDIVKEETMEDNVERKRNRDWNNGRKTRKWREGKEGMMEEESTGK